MTKLVVQVFNQFYAVAQRGIYRMCCFAVEVVEVIQALDPVTVTPDFAVVTPIVRRLEQTVVWTVSLGDYFLHQ